MQYIPKLNYVSDEEVKKLHGVRCWPFRKPRNEGGRSHYQRSISRQRLSH